MKTSKIWFKPFTLEQLNERGSGTIVSHLGIEILEFGSDFLRGSMPVDDRTRQPAGILHGGASVVLAESLGSIAANLVIDHEQFIAVGLEINANHLRPAREGFVEGVARPIHLGVSTQVWEIRITHEGKPSCISRLTMAVLPKSRIKP